MFNNGNLNGGNNNQYYPVSGQGGSGNNLDFQQFSYDNQQQQQYPPPPQRFGGSQSFGGSYDSSSSSNQRQEFTGGAVTWQSIQKAFSSGGYDNEPPLLEELGINFSHILAKAIAVLNPFKAIDGHIMDDTDLAGPLIFCFAFGAFLLLSGKVHFGYIYGIATMGCVFMYTILNLMSSSGIDAYRVASVLGYSLLPIVILSCFSILVDLSGVIGLVFSGMGILWCAFSASSMFVAVLEMKEQRFLVAYPVALIYSAFAIVTVF